MSEEKFTREEVSSLIQQGHILPENVQSTLTLTGITPQAQQKRMK